jgi:outer membrane protein TolC
MAGGLLSQERQISIAITDLPQLLEKTSPQQKLINARQAITKARIDATLQWSNPGLSYTREYVEKDGIKETQHLVNLSKTFSMPWVYWQQRSIWQTDFEAAKLKREQDTKQLLAVARAGYVELSLLKKLTKQQIYLKDLLSKIKQVVRAQSDEGAISRLEARLLAMSVFGLEGDILRTHKKNRLATSTLKQLLGFDSLDDIILSTSIPFIKIQTDFTDKLKIIENHSGLKSRQERLSAKGQRITLEKSRIIPYVSLQGGYKKIEPGWEGYTLGLSIPLPALNWNGPQIEKQRINHKVQLMENLLYKQKLQSKIENLIVTVKSYFDLLQENRGEQYSFALIEDLLAAYQEGTMSLPEFLNTMRIYRDGSKQYTEQLTEYYQAVFELEALYGKQLAIF